MKLAKPINLKLAPFIEMGSPGKIEAGDAVDAGAQDLPGKWESAASTCRNSFAPFRSWDTRHGPAYVQ
jgi:hypothetical protein